MCMAKEGRAEEQKKQDRQILIRFQINRIIQIRFINIQFRIVKIIKFLAQNNMINIQSPFIKQIPQCKLIMRRLRKKISKYTSTHKEAKKPRDQSHDILNILKSRNLPSFILQTIRKRRTFDLLCLKNVVLTGESDLGQMTKLAGSQEIQIQSMFAEHKLRIRKPHARVLPKLEKRATNYSSTQEEEEVSDSNYDEISSCFGEGSLKKEMNTENQQFVEQDNFEEDGPGFHGRDFLSFEGEMYSEEEWLKF